MLRARTLLAHAPFFRNRLRETEDGNGCRVRRAVTAEELRLAHEVIGHLAVHRPAWHPVTPPAEGLYRAIPATAVFIAEQADALVGVLALVPDIPGLGLPSDERFPRELRLLREMGPRAAEITDVALASAAPRVTVLTELFRAVFAQACHDRREEVFVAVTGHYERFFEEVLQFDRWDMQGARPPQGKRFFGKRFSLASIGQRLADMDHWLGPEAFLHTFFVEANAHHGHIGRWSTRAAETFEDPQVLRHLFAEQPNLLDHLSDRHREVLRNQWGAGLFDAVMDGCLASVPAI